VETALTSEPKVEEVKTDIVPEPKVEEVPTMQEYDLELKDDSPLSIEELNEIAEYAGIHNLTKEAAEKLIEAREKSYTQGMTKAEAAYAAKLDEQKVAIMKDPDFVGEKKAETFASISRAVQAYGSPELVAALNTPEFGNNIVLARFLKKIGDAMASDTFPGKSAGPGNIDANAGSLKNLYPEFYK
jgi:hypothetical protein